MVTDAELEAKRAEVAGYRTKLQVARQATPVHTVGGKTMPLGVYLYGDLPDRWLATLESELSDLEFRAKLPQG